MTSKSKHDNYNCADIENLVQRYLDTDLDDQEKQAFEEHLEYCLPCDKKIEFEKKIKNLLRDKMRLGTSSAELKGKLERFINNMDNI